MFSHVFPGSGLSQTDGLFVGFIAGKFTVKWGTTGAEVTSSSSMYASRTHQDLGMWVKWAVIYDSATSQISVFRDGMLLGLDNPTISPYTAGSRIAFTST